MGEDVYSEHFHRGFVVRHHKNLGGYGLPSMRDDIVCIHAGEINNIHNSLLLKTIEALVATEEYNDLVHHVLSGLGIEFNGSTPRPRFSTKCQIKDEESVMAYHLSHDSAPLYIALAQGLVDYFWDEGRHVREG